MDLRTNRTSGSVAAISGARAAFRRPVRRSKRIHGYCHWLASLPVLAPWRCATMHICRSSFGYFESVGPILKPYRVGTRN